MIAIKNVFFDLGNVLFAFDYNRFHEKANGGGTIAVETEQAVHALAVELECGRLPEALFLRELLLLYPGLATTERTLNYWSDIFTPIESTIACVRGLRQSGRYHIGVISNTNAPHIRQLRRLSNVLDCFDSLTLSHEIGCMKPDLAIYHAALQNANAQPRESLFFDDRADNVAAAQSIGIHAIQVNRPEDVLAGLGGLAEG
jgi:glucose-1-phosphatase